MKKVSTNLYLYEDTCNVYVIKTGEKAIAIDFGNGNVLQHLSSIGVQEITDVLMTHHHRDQAQGLHLAAERGIRIWVPHTEQDLFHSIDEHWKAREIDNNYNNRQDRFSLLQPVPVYKTLKDYQTINLNGHKLTILPTPGHTTGSISIVCTIDQAKVAFTGDLIYGPGKVWSMSATQWSYNGGEGIALSVLSLLELKDRNQDLLLPSHGTVMKEPNEAITLLIERFTELMKLRKQNPRLFQLREKPYENVTPHLLKNRTSMANTYVVISKTGKALLFDFGYDFIGGLAAGADRASRRPWLYTISKLKEQYGIEKIDVVIPTHFHDDHVAGFNLLREVEGTKVWCPENFSDILENPKTYDLPCIWYDSIPVDKTLPLSQKVKWEEYEFTLYEQSGHTLYAVAIDFEIDGKRVLVIGDQYQGDDINYVYHNKFRMWDYCDSAELYKRLRPDIIIAGHCDPIHVTEDYLQTIEDKGALLERLHQELLPLEDVDFGAVGFGAVITPYQSIVKSGQTISFDIEIKNPFSSDEEAIIRLVTPKNWAIVQDEYNLQLAGSASNCLTVTIVVPEGIRGYKERIAVDLTVGNTNFGQHAEALVTII